MSSKLSSKLFKLLKKTNCALCSKRYVGVNVKPENVDPFSKMNIMKFINLFLYYYFKYLFFSTVAPYSESPKDQQRLYVWGMAEHGALGDLKIRSRERQIQFIYRPVRLRFSYSHKV